MSQREYGDDDVKKFIEKASSIAHRSADALSADDLKKIGTDLGFSDAVVSGALQALERDRVRSARDEERRAALKKRNTKLVMAFVAFDVVALAGLYGHGASLKSDAEVHRAAIVTALDRQREVEKRFAPGTRESDAEIAGSLNRVSIARKRYDEAAIAYNESIARALFMRERLPPSSEVHGSP
jgi:hypothetical protein